MLLTGLNWYKSPSFNSRSQFVVYQIDWFRQDEDLIASFGSLRVLKKLGLCFQPPWKPLHSEIFFDENSPYENGERLLDLGQATILRIAQLIHARGGRELREIEIQVLRHLSPPSLHCNGGCESSLIKVSG